MLYLSGGDDNPHVRKAREAARQRQQLSLLSVQEGGLPLNVRDRLLEQARRQNTERHCFTSDLSVNELSLVHLAGYEPLGQIMGSAVCYVAQDWLPYDVRQDGFSFALESLPQAFNEARQLGLGRL
ncbi:MAG: hypothetical protein JOZ57_06690, partial [Abitibacteriaceae bacterium]|nr:hypothetical protein [Abditibacteriaceae bacterium]